MKNILDKELFNLDKKRFQIKKKDFKENLKEFYKLRQNKTFSRDEYDSWKMRICSTDTIVRQYGSWENALKDVGIPINKKHEYSIEELLEHFEKVWRWVEQAPSIGDLKKYNLKFNTSVTYDAFSRRWGSYTKFQKIFSLYKLGELNLNEVIQKSKDSKKIKRTLSPLIRSKVLKKFNYKCTHCGRTVADNIKLEIDHIVPLSKKGKNEIGNLQVLCNECNIGKSNRFAG